ncbi:MAG: hypothetical protein MI922_28130, partial [Bacteroidales bacterium]|nr:hypothetical protein [Bacteroidales bacterium]
FGYTRSVMQVLSNDMTFVETIMNLKTKERKMKVKRNQAPYVYLISTERKKTNFYRRWKDTEQPDDDEILLQQQDEGI